MTIKRTLLWFCCTIMLAINLQSQQNLQQIHSIVQKRNFTQQRLPVSRVAQNPLQRGEKPGAFKNVDVKYTERVKLLTASQKNNIGNKMAVDGLLNQAAIADLQAQPGDIFVDPESDLILQFEPITDEDLVVFRPQMHQVFETFTIPDQTVGLTLANTTQTIDHSTVSGGQENGIYNMVMHFDSIPYSIKEDNVEFNVTLVGDIKFSNPRIEGHYSKNNGYKLVFKAKEAIDLDIYSNVKYKKEIKTPLWGFKIEAGQYGQCDLGVFLVVDINGEVNLEIEVDQGYELTAGVKGGTFYYIPTKIRPVLEVNNWCDINYQLAGEITAFAGIQCQAKLKIKGYNALDIKARGGVEGIVKTDGRYLSSDLGMRMKVYGKVVSKNFTLLDKYYSFYQTKERDYGNYNMQILEACAYRDYVVGHIQTIDSKESYNGPLTIHLKTAKGTNRTFNGHTDQDGYFVVKDVPMKKGDKIAIQLDRSPNLSDYVTPTIPFNEINLMYADYYTGQVHGMVAGKISQYEDLIKKSSNNNTPANSAANRVAMAGQSLAVDRNVVTPHSTAIERITQFKNRLIAYKGPVNIQVQPLPTAVPLNGSANQRNNRQKAIRRPINNGISKPQRQLNPNIQKPTNNRGNISSPLGVFTVNKMKLNPTDKVRAKIMVEGFEVYSDWIVTDGLMITGIETENLSSSIQMNQLTVRGDQAQTIVSALRSDQAPTGTIRLVKGEDLSHSSIQPPYTKVDGLKQLKKPFVWFDQQINLQPVTTSSGVSVAQINNWTSTITYSSPADLLSPLSKGGHAFEMVSYKYHGREVGYKTVQTECPGCDSPIDVVKGIQKSTLQNQPLEVGHQKISKVKVMKQPQVKQQGAALF